MRTANVTHASLRVLWLGWVPNAHTPSHTVPFTPSLSNRLIHTLPRARARERACARPRCTSTVLLCTGTTELGCRGGPGRAVLGWEWVFPVLGCSHPRSPSAWSPGGWVNWYVRCLALHTLPSTPAGAGTALPPPREDLPRGRARAPPPPSGGGHVRLALSRGSELLLTTTPQRYFTFTTLLVLLRMRTTTS